MRVERYLLPTKNVFWKVKSGRTGLVQNRGPISRAAIHPLPGQFRLCLFSSELDPLPPSKKPCWMIYGCQTNQEAVFLDLSSLPAGLGGPNSWDQAKASCLGEEGGQERPTSEEQASRGQPGSSPLWRQDVGPL